MRKYQIYVICFVVLAFAAATATRVCSNRNILCSVVRSTSCSKKIVSSHCPRLCNTCGAKCRNIKASMRVDCGYHGISPLDCLRKGCCYGELKVAGPWCYHRKANCPMIEANKREDCGYPGISKSDCVKKGCCYNVIKEKGPWCYYRQGKLFRSY
ncbi:trefoil factor 2-like [Hydractinia symbiolongicarpus]|uniref:trefoil factor 2-like n=1 Tax=Hydractinia symbiolongicarpus TaxID=13093 RepID=UPI00254E9D99|nr:trefoil factor 2-like [Hydractinia symbiolongicarpus]XP_057300924.1 trefoil factor 2-like [Hydractinia symbiolongicarpus]